MPATTDRKQVRVPTSIRPSADVLAKVRKIAKANGIKPAVVFQLALVGGLTIVETKLAEIRINPEAAEVAPTRP